MKLRLHIAALLSIQFITTSVLPAEENLPAQWKHQDIGTAEIPGKAEHASGVWTLHGSMDLWGVADGCQFAWEPVNGDLELVARVKAIENPGGVAHAKASLCIRESIAAGSRHVTLCVTPTDGTQFIYRDKLDGKTTRVPTEAEAQKNSVPKGQFPCWLKLVRHGDEFTGYESTDGEKWQVTGHIALDLAPETLTGMAASSHKKDVLTTVTFDQIKLSKLVGAKK